MVAIETAALGLARAIVRKAATSFLADRRAAADRKKELSSLFGSWWPGSSMEGRLIAETVAGLEPLLEHEYPGLQDGKLQDGDRIAALDLLASVFERADLSDRAILADNLDGELLAARLRAQSRPALEVLGLGEAGDAYYTAVLNGSSRLFMRAIEQLPALLGRAQSEILRRLDQLVQDSAEMRAVLGKIAAPPAPAPPARSHYLDQVKKIAPAQLLDRRADLDRLARFCLDPDGGAYLWVSAGEWAGKSAVLSTFVLNPPRGVRVVSFFITARFGEDSRELFLTRIIEQLSELLKRPAPDFGTRARETIMLELLTDAAEACRHDGERLVLVVDGLDEERRAAADARGQSISGSLPVAPPHGMRVVVSGRPNRPMPDDVPDAHPLRDSAIVWTLGASPHARDIERRAREELKRLLAGSDLEQDVLGLIAAARGGLSGPDLRELTHAQLPEVENVVWVSARHTFAQRAGLPRGDDTEDQYLLGHEELQRAAERYLDPPRLNGYVTRLLAWAETYQLGTGERGGRWPPRTPDYLLLRYPSLLERIGDAGRLVSLATDALRHDRLLDVYGGDSAAFDEIETTQELLLARDDPDLAAMVRVAIHRDSLVERNANLPGDLPAVWRKLDEPVHAEFLVAGIDDGLGRKAEALTILAEVTAEAGDLVGAETLANKVDDNGRRVRALAGIARAAATRSDPERAGRLAGEAERLARRLADEAERLARLVQEPGKRAGALSVVARAVDAAGDNGKARRLMDDAETAAGSVSRPKERAELLADLAGTTLDGGDDPGRGGRLLAAATSAADAVDWLDERAQVMAAAARVAVATGAPDVARGLISDAEELARRAVTSYSVGQAMAEVAWASAAAGDLSRADAVAGAITDPYGRAAALSYLVWAAADAGDAGRAETIARTIDRLDELARALTVAAWAAADAGNREQARRLATDAEAAARSAGSPDRQANARVDLVHAAAEAGLVETGERIARSIVPDHLRAGALARLARAAAGDDNDNDNGNGNGNGDAATAARLSADAEATARAIGDADAQAMAFAAVAEEAARGGDLVRAEEIARLIGPRETQERALAEVARAAADRGDFDRAGRIAGSIDDELVLSVLLGDVAMAAARAGDFDRSEVVAGAIGYRDSRDSRLSDLAIVAADAGDLDRAERIALSLDMLDSRVTALAGVGRRAAACGDPGRANRLIGLAQVTAGLIDDPMVHDRALTEVVRQIGATGDLDGAEAVAATMKESSWRIAAISALISSAGEAGDHERAVRLVAEATTGTIGDDFSRTNAIGGLALAAIEVGELDRGRMLASALDDPIVRTLVLVAVVEKLTKMGDPGRAEQVADTIVDSSAKARAFMAVAGAVPSGDSHRLLGKALAAGFWLEPLKALARREPGLFRHVVETAM